MLRFFRNTLSQSFLRRQESRSILQAIPMYPDSLLLSGVDLRLGKI